MRVLDFFEKNKLLGPPAIAAVLTWMFIVSLKTNILTPLFQTWYPTDWEGLAVTVRGHEVRIGEFVAELLQYVFFMAIIILWAHSIK